MAEVLKASQLPQNDSVPDVQIGGRRVDTELGSERATFFACLMDASSQSHVAFRQDFGAAAKLFGFLDDVLGNDFFRVFVFCHCLLFHHLAVLRHSGFLFDYCPKRGA